MDLEAVQELEVEVEETTPQGYSAYEVAVQNGYEGTESEWLESLKGADGATGAQGQPGADGQDGADATINGVSTINIVAGDNITLEQEDGTLTINSTGGGTRDYADLTNKPSINNVPLNGNKSLSDLGAGTYDKPASGIPKTDLASDVQASLSKADTALQSETYTGTITGITMNGSSKGTSGIVDLGTVITQHQDISGKQDALTAGANITIDENNVISATGGANYTAGEGIDITNDIISSTMPVFILDNHSSQNPLIINGCKKGIYFFNNQKYAYLKGYSDIGSANTFEIVDGFIIITDSGLDKTVNDYKDVGYIYGTMYEMHAANYINVSAKLRVWQPNGMISIYNNMNYTPFVNPTASATISGTHTYSALPQSSVVPTSDNQFTNKKYVDDISAANAIQYSTMPTASASTVGKIVQYTGTTNANYTNGYFYIGTTDGEATPTYGWSNIEVQGGGGNNNTIPACFIDIDSDFDKFEQVRLGSVYRSSTSFTSAMKTTLQTFLQNCYENNVDAFEIVLGHKKASSEKSVPLLKFYVQGNTIKSLSTNPTTIEMYATDSVYVNQGPIYTFRLYIALSWSGNTLTVSNASFIRDQEIPYLNKANTTSYTPSGDYNPATKKYVDDAVASAGSSVPTITITVSQIVSQDPIQISLTAEQQAIIEDDNVGTLIVDGSALRVTPVYCQKNENRSTDILLAAFSFDWDVSSGFNISDTTIFAGHYDKQTHILTIVNTPLLGNTPTADNHLANKKYVDDAVAGAGGSSTEFLDLSFFSPNVVDNEQNIYVASNHEHYEEINTLFTKINNGEFPCVYAKVNLYRKDFNDNQTPRITTNVVPCYFEISGNSILLKTKMPNDMSLSYSGYGINRGLVFYKLSYDTFMGAYKISYYSNMTRNRFAWLDEIEPVVETKLKSLASYDATKTQILKNISGTLTWVDE